MCPHGNIFRTPLLRYAQHIDRNGLKYSVYGIASFDTLNPLYLFTFSLKIGSRHKSCISLDLLQQY